MTTMHDARYVPVVLSMKVMLWLHVMMMANERVLSAAIISEPQIALCKGKFCLCWLVWQ